MKTLQERLVEKTGESESSVDHKLVVIYENLNALNLKLLDVYCEYKDSLTNKHELAKEIAGSNNIAFFMNLMEVFKESLEEIVANTKIQFS